MISNKTFLLFALALIVPLTVASESAQADLRELQVGDKMPAFALPELEGEQFTYQVDANDVSVIIFVSAHQKHSERAVADLETVISKFPSQQVRLIAVTIEVKDKEYFQSWRQEQKHTFPILLDTQHKLWGQLGIIATPTVILVDKEGALSWIRAGYSYDFAPVLQAHLAQVLGQADPQQTERASQVETLANTTMVARMKRHLKMAQMLTAKGRFESAIKQLRKAQEQVPDSVEVLLELGQLLCRTAQGQEALQIAEKIEIDNKSQLQLASAKMIAGWAHRQLGDLTLAEKLLNESLLLNPRSARTRFELGRVYQVRGEQEKAMQSYYRALALLFREPASTAISHKR